MSIDWLKSPDLLKKTLIWGVFFGILYVLRSLFGVVFLTFILAFITFRAADFISKHTGLSQRLSIVLLYIVLLLTISGFAGSIIPRVLDETKQFLEGLPALQKKVILCVY